MKSKVIASVLPLVTTYANKVEHFAENLKIWRLSDQLTLHSFDFTFTIDDIVKTGRNLDYFPSQFYELVREVPQLTSVEVDLT